MNYHSDLDPVRHEVPLSVHIIDSVLETVNVQQTLFDNLDQSIADELEAAGLLTNFLKFRVTNYVSQFASSKHNVQTQIDIAALLFEGDVGNRYIKIRSDMEMADFYMLRNSSKQIILEAHQRLIHAEESWLDISLRWGTEPEKNKSGYYPSMPVAKLPQEVRTILRQLKEGQFSNPTRLGKYFGVIQLISYRKPELTEQLRNEILIILYNEWIDSRVNDLKTRYLASE